MPMGNVENLPPCAEIGDPYGGATDPLCPVPNHRKGHVLHVIVGEKDTFQVVEDDLDSPVGGVPNFCVVAAPGCGDTDLHHGLLKVRERPLLRCLRKAVCIMSTQCSSTAAVSSFWAGRGSRIVSMTAFPHTSPLLICATKVSSPCPAVPSKSSRSRSIASTWLRSRRIVPYACRSSSCVGSRPSGRRRSISRRVFLRLIYIDVQSLQV